MAEGRIKDSELSAIAAAIRSKNGESTVYKPAEMAQAILDIPAGGSAVIESKSITQNGTYTAPTGVDGYNPVTVAVQPNLQSKTVTQNGTVTPDTGYDGLSSVVVNVQAEVKPINIFHPKTYTSAIYNTPDPGVSITRATDDLATIRFNGTKTTNSVVNCQLQVPDAVVRTFIGCKVRAVSDDPRVYMHIQKQTSPYTFYGSTSGGVFMTIPAISDSGVVFCMDVKESGDYDNVTGYLEVLGIE